MKKITVIILAAVGILLAGAAETLAVLVDQGSFESTFHNGGGTFSGGTGSDNFEVSFLTGGGAFTSLGTFNIGHFDISFTASTTIRIGSDTCAVGGSPTCGGSLTFSYPANLLPGGPSTADAPFTMTGHLTVGSKTITIDGSGNLHVSPTGPPFTAEDPILARFVVAEPSTVVLVLSGLVAVGWSRWRGGKRAGSSRSTAAAD
jgi:hypothetical protein